MKFIESINDSYYEQMKLKGDNFFSKSIEGYLFWFILSSSYHDKGKPDYLTIIKIHNRFGIEAFKLDISIIYYIYYHDKYYDFSESTINEKALEILFKEIEKELLKRKSKCLIEKILKLYNPIFFIRNITQKAKA